MKQARNSPPPARGRKNTAQKADEGGTGPPTRRRLPPGEREKMILDGAIRFFAEVGFEGQTRELAKRLGITQPLIFRYFPTKDALIERVYQEVYLSRWNPWWEELLEDRSLPLKERLVTFYKAYVRAIFSYEWVRIFIYSGLKGENINKRYLDMVRERVLQRICAELRADAGIPGAESAPIGETELELAWGLHGGIFYIAIRRWIYEVESPADIDAVIEASVESFLAGAPKVIARMVAAALDSHAGSNLSLAK